MPNSIIGDQSVRRQSLSLDFVAVMTFVAELAQSSGRLGDCPPEDWATSAMRFPRLIVTTQGFLLTLTVCEIRLDCPLALTSVTVSVRVRDFSPAPFVENLIPRRNA